MQSIFGALLTAGFATAMTAAIAADPNAGQVSSSVQSQMTKSFAGAEEIAKQNPQYASEITAAAKSSFLDGDDRAYTAGIVAILLGAGLVYFKFPKKAEEEAMLARFHSEDVPAGAAPGPSIPERPEDAPREGPLGGPAPHPG